LGWEDSTIELPDDPCEGVELIKDLVKDKERLSAIHRRNYLETLIRNDWRLRMKSMLEILKLPIPAKLGEQVGQIHNLYIEKSNIHWYTS
jgi:hypothetical protein